MKSISMRPLILLLAAPLFAANTLDIYFIDVDHGNAVLVVSPSGESLLLDSGAPEHKYAERILATMKTAGVKQIDYFRPSHYHWDHYGTIAEIAAHVPVLNFVDHGTNVEYQRSPEYNRQWSATPVNKDYDNYVKTRARGKHTPVAPGDRIPIKGIEAIIVSSAGRVLAQPLEGAGAPSPGCWMSSERIENEEEDGQSVGVLIRFGQFRFIDLGDLTWNVSRRLFCPENKVGQVDLYMMTHHGISFDRESLGPEQWSASSGSPAEVYGLHPRVAVLSAGEDYVTRLATPEAWQTTRSSPGLEDIWELHYQAQGGAANNSDERFIACPNQVNCQGGDWIKVSAQQDGGFSVTNKRNGYTKKYPARRAGGAK